MFQVVLGKQPIKTYSDFQQAMAYATKLAYAQPTKKRNKNDVASTPVYHIVEV